MEAQAVDQAGFLGDIEKLFRWYGSQFRIIPACECLDPAQATALAIDLGLISKLHLIELDRGAQTVGEFESAGPVCFQIGTVEPVTDVASMHRGNGVAHQILGIAPVERVETDPDSDANVAVASGHAERAGKGLLDIVSELGRVAIIGDLWIKEYELIVLPAGHNAWLRVIAAEAVSDAAQ